MLIQSGSNAQPVFSSSGAANVQLTGISAASNLIVTATGTANSAVTLTLPAAGVGLFHYITALCIARTSTAVLAGTATLVITSTNLDTGSTMAWSVGNAMIAGGTQRDVEMFPCTPHKSLTANTATTIVMPAPGAAVLWRAYAWYYTAI